MTMPKPLDYLQWLAELCDEQLRRLNEQPSPEERTRLLRRMKILIDGMDQAALSALEEDKSIVTSSHQQHTPQSSPGNSSSGLNPKN